MGIFSKNLRISFPVNMSPKVSNKLTWLATHLSPWRALSLASKINGLTRRQSSNKQPRSTLLL